MEFGVESTPGQVNVSYLFSVTKKKLQISICKMGSDKSITKVDDKNIVQKK